MKPGSRPATLEDIHRIASGLPGVTRTDTGPTVYQVSRRSFLFFRNPRPDAVDPVTGERWTDVIVFWVEFPSWRRRPSWPTARCRSSPRRTSMATHRSCCADRGWGS
jgi:hypothetical protein